MVRSRTITLVLFDGVATGVIKYTLHNWSGVVYKIPRASLKDYEKREDLQHSGVYFLFGESGGRNVVYVGQAVVRKNGNGLLGRIREDARHPKKDYWNEVVAITTKDNSLGPTEISYLEHHFANLAKETKRYSVEKANDPNPGNVTEEKEIELEEFIEYSKIVMEIAGHKVFVPLDEVVEKTSTRCDSINRSEIKLYLKERGAEAIGILTSDGIIVCKGSRLKDKATPSCQEWIKKSRAQNSAYINSNFILSKDIPFSTPSAAAGFCVYASVNGRTAWKTEDGKTLKDLEAEV